ncbi:MAG: hypothetical protein IJ048_12940 [Clostridia bacterium]|nr:hypothetical protein [Clostridia bacterium]
MKTKTQSAARSGQKRIQEKRRRDRSRMYTKIFYGVYALTIVALFFLLFKASRMLNDYVKAYEAAQPKYAAMAAARPFLERDYDALAQCEDPAVFQVETRAQYDAYMDRLLAGRVITYNEVLSDDENVKRYDVKADDMKIGAFSLRHDGEDGRFGFWRWRVDAMDTDVLSASAYTVEVPEQSTVTVNGLALTADDVIRWNIPEFSTVPLPEGAQAPRRCVYQFQRYFGPGEVRVTDRYGEANEVSAAGSRYTAAFNYDDRRLAPELEERVIQVVRRLSCYMSNDYALRNLNKDLVDKSNAQKYVEAFDIKWILDHKSYDFENMDVRNYVSYSPDCFSVEARYDFKIIYYTVDPEIYPTAYRLYFQKIGETWKLFDFELI